MNRAVVRQFVSAIRLALIAAALAAAIPFNAASAGSSLSDLRAQQATKLQALETFYADLAKQAGTNTDLLKDSYIQERNQIRQSFLDQDTRWSDFQKLKAQLGNGIKNTGKPPADVRADMDIRANTNDAANKVVDTWKARGDVVEELPEGMGFVNKTGDMTVWSPCDTPACLKAKVAYYDAFGTQGGLRASGNTDAGSDPYGYGLDNEKKFLHGLEEGDIKTVAKSVNKAGKAAGISETDTEFWRQAQNLEEYGNLKTAGIADMNASPAQAQQKLSDWLKVAQDKMAEALAELKQEGALRDQSWRQGAENLRNSNAADETVRQWDIQDAEEMIAQRNRVLESNVATEQANAQTRGQAGRRPVTLKGVVGGAAMGAASAAVGTFALCLANNGMDHVKQCADQARGSMPLGAFVGMVAAVSPFLEGVLIGYGAGQGVINIGEASYEGVGAVYAGYQMQQAESRQQLQALANFANKDAFLRRTDAMEKKIRAIELNSVLFSEACEASQQSGSATWVVLAGQLRKQLPATKTSLIMEITAFGYAYPETPVITSLTEAWHGRVSQAASIVERMPSCIPI